jgi:hypothetical protein
MVTNSLVTDACIASQTPAAQPSRCAFGAPEHERPRRVSTKTVVAAIAPDDHRCAAERRGASGR